MTMRGPIDEFIDELIVAIRNGNTSKALRLLKKQEVRDNAAAHGNYALQIAATFDFVNVARELLKIQAVRDAAADINNIVLGCTLIHENVELALELLKIQSVRDNAAFNDNHALHSAISNQLYPVVEELLKIPSVQQSLLVSKGFNELENDLENMPLEMLQNIREAFQPAFENISTMPTGSNFSSLTNHIEENVDFYGFWSVLSFMIDQKALQAKLTSALETSCSSQDDSLVTDDIPPPPITLRRSKRLMEARLAKENQKQASDLNSEPKRARKR